MRVIANTSSAGWPTRLSSDDGNVYVECGPTTGLQTSPDEYRQKFESLVRSLVTYRELGLNGAEAVRSSLAEIASEGIDAAAIASLAYVEPDGSGRVFAWPDQDAGLHDVRVGDTGGVPFRGLKWMTLPLYRGNYGPVSNIQFSVKDAVRIKREYSIDVWFALLEAYVFEQGNDAILQKTAFIEVASGGEVVPHEETVILENAGGGGPYDLIMSDLVVTARGDVIAALPNHYELGNVLLSLDMSAFTSTQVSTFQTPSRELIPVARDVDIEVMKYLRRFPDHVTEMPAHSFEKIVAEILASHGFSDIQLNVRNVYGEIDIVAFESSSGKKQGYIVECKRYARERKVVLCEAHVLAMKRILMQREGIDRAMLVTTSDFTSPTRRLYDSAWGIELKAYDEVMEWLRTYKPPKGEHFV